MIIVKISTLLILLDGKTSKLVEICLLNIIAFSLVPEAGCSSFGKLKRVALCLFLVSGDLLLDTGVENITPTLKW